ncbi:MAG: CRISPR-associated RAMP protein Csx10 [Gemmatales bacterium]|nr:MAG: CRISPR-associated RAMP protein Csx10 [Gemmatales bacterium]
MKRYRVKAHLESPVVVRRERQSQRSEGVQFIAGTLLRGALAQAYLQYYGHADATFRQLFLDEEVCRFGPLDPADRVFPLTANSCKRVPGFSEDGKHGITDLLTVSLKKRLSQRTVAQQRCRNCGQELKSHSGFWHLKANSTPTEPKRRWRRSMAAHVGIDRPTQTAAESIFFTLPALEPEPTTDGEASLHGWVDAEQDALQALKQLLSQEDHILRIGHARTRGYGRVRVTIGEEVPLAPVDFSGWSKGILSRTAPELSPDRYFLFTVSLPTGAVLVDDLLRYTLDPAGMVPWLPPLPPPVADTRTFDTPGKEFEGGRLWCVTAVAHHERLRGWNAAHGLPRQDEWLVTRGSVYAYLYEGNSTGQAALHEKLRDLEANGIGARRNEGFGRVAVCDDFHLRFAPTEAI